MKKYQSYIELHNIQKTYNNDVVLNIDNYRIPLDGMVTIVGFSGNGKTTLLNIIGLLDVPDNIDGASPPTYLRNNFWRFHFNPI